MSYTPGCFDPPAMRALFIHAERFEYKTRERTPVAEEVPEGGHQGTFEEALVCFLTMEEQDEPSIPEVARAAAADVFEVANKVQTKRLVLYPYAHLASHLAAPQPSREILDELELLLKEKGFEVHRAPFGWYKSFTISCKGHPLAELSRQITAEGAKKARPTGDRYLVLDLEGNEHEVTAFGGGGDGFQGMMKKEALKEEHKASGEPAYLRLCKKFGIEWEGMSDAGHQRYQPKAALMFDLVADYAQQVVQSIGLSVMIVKGTNMFSLREKAVREHAELFGDRLYSIETDRGKFVMRYAACHEQFSMMKDWTISYKQLPLGALEIADAYRFEQSGETTLLFRVRRLNMPDLHVLCADDAMARDWFLKIHERIGKEAAALGREYELLINVSSRKALDDNKDLILDLCRREKRPALIHIYPEGINFYWTVNVEYMVTDSMKHSKEIATVQIDTGNAERFGIKFTDEGGKPQRPIILHTAVLGSIERYLYLVFDTAVMREAAGKPGILPLWLNPEQVRLLPVNESHLPRCRELAEILRRSNLRCGIDDRSEGVSRKVRDAKADWVGFVIVVGDKEMEFPTVQSVLKVYDREQNVDRPLSLGELIRDASERVAGKPTRPLYFPAEVSKRPG